MKRNDVARCGEEAVMVEKGRTCEALDLIGRLQTVLTRMDLDCSCREILSDALERFSNLSLSENSDHT